MRRLIVAIALLGALTVLLSLGASADVIRVTSVPGIDVSNPINVNPTSYGTNGWTCVRLKNETGAKAKAGLSYFYQPTKGTPGPLGGGSFYLQSGENNADGKECQQAWLGTDWYGSSVLEDDGLGGIVERGPKLNTITKLSYYAIMEKRGEAGNKLLSLNFDDPNFHIKFADQIYVIGYDAGTGTFERLATSSTEAGATKITNPYRDVAFQTKYDKEYIPLRFVSQPPAIVIYITDGTNWRNLIYRPWNDGTGASRGMGTNNGARCDRWKKYDCLVDGCWYNPGGEANTDGTKMWSWSELAADTKYGNWYIDTPNLTTLSVLFDGDGARNTAPTGCSINFTLGALNKDWWGEAFNAYGAIDDFEIAFNDSGTVIDDTYDFEQSSLQTPAPKMLNNKAMYEQVWMPEDPTNNPHGTACLRTRADVPWGGGTGGSNPGTYYYPYCSVLQKAACYNAGYIVGNASQLYPNKYVLYGKVLSDPAPTSDIIYVDDGSGKNVLVYSADGFPEGYLGGEYVRCEGSCWVATPFDWVYNYFHVIELAGTEDWRDPTGTWTDVLTKPHEPEFHTYGKDVQTLHNAF